MGGQQAYYWGVMHGSTLSSNIESSPFVKNIIVICSSAKTSAHNYTVLEGPKAALETASDYHGGRYRELGIIPKEGIRAFGRAFAGWLTSAEWFRRGLWREFGAESLKDWLYPGDGKGPFDAFDAEDLLVVLKMWQAGDIGDVGGNGDWRNALEMIESRVLVMPSRTDQYFSPNDSKEEMKHLKRGVYVPIETIWGHVAGGGANDEDKKFIDKTIAEFLQS